MMARMVVPVRVCRAMIRVFLAAPAATGQDSSPARIRFATFNVALNRGQPGELAAELRSGRCKQAHAVAEIVQRVRPHVLVINELDHDASGDALRALQQLYLSEPHGGAAAIQFPHAFVAPVNTGVPTGLDLDGDGETDGPGDAHGYGAFPGQYGMAVLSRFPIDRAAVRSFQKLLWRDMPDALWPDDPATAEPGDFYPVAARDVLRLSSKSHWDVPITIGTHVVHVLASHPTPPVFDGAEDRNGRRNHDEIRVWADYVDPARSGWIRDDAGRQGGLAAGAHFVIAGDLNADPVDGDSYEGAIAQLLDHGGIDARMPPHSAGSHLATRRQAGANGRHRGDSATDTADFSDRDVGNLRLDYVLPSRTLSVADVGVFWPSREDPLFALVGGGEPIISSDHRLVWADVRWPPPPPAGPEPDVRGQAFGDLCGARFLAPFTFAEHELTLVRWWTNGCPMCADTLPALETLRARYAARGFAVVGMYHPKPQRDVSDGEVRQLGRALGFAGDLALDPGWDKLAELQARGAPTEATSISVLVDGAGKIVWVHPGPRIHPDTDGAHRAAGDAFAALESMLRERLR
jgi:hypothetical protein